MAIELVCSCGAVLRFEQPPAAGRAQCPECQAEIRVPPVAPSSRPEHPAAVGRKPLWALMGRPPEAVDPAAQSPPFPQPADEPDISTIETPEATGEPVETRPARKGLWGVMQNAPPANSPANPAAAPNEPVAPAAATAPFFAAAPAKIGEPVAASAMPQVASDPALAELFGATANEALAAVYEKADEVHATNSRRAILSLSLGIASIPIAFLALINSIWSRLPAPLVGFLAILTGLVAAQEIQGSAGRKTGRKYATYGIIAGIVGSFLGPVVMSGLGRRLMQSSSRGLTTAHLKTIGAALTEYEKQRSEFPPGGVFRKTKAGDMRGYHGWMTMLLPWVDEGDLYAAIRQNLPYDDDANLHVFSQDVPVFFASGTDQSKVRGRFGVTHFAGLGGEITDDEAGDKRVRHVGLFGMNSSVTRGDVTDGLSNTLAAGEIADDLPPWGDPENWRSIGKGLNRDRQGFGNHDRSGACFLMADGSVRFFSNKTDIRVLTALSTRDGGEP